jgi:acyl-CoA synthetase (AMP-forming)/AMP-acid ligase II
MTSVTTHPGRIAPVTDASLTDFVTADWHLHGTRTALVDASTGRRISYAELASAVRRAASGLRRQGLAAGDAVALCCPNSAEFVVACYGALMAGGVVTTLSPLVTEAEAATQLADSGARWVLTTPDAADRLARAGGSRLAGLFLVDALPSAPQDLPLPDISADDSALVLYSSGTTGLPKGVQLTHRSVVSGLRAMQVPDPVGADDVVLAVLPMHHIAGLHIVLNHALAAGATVVTLPSFDLETFLDAIARHHVTRFVAAPPIVLALAKHPAVDRYDLSSLRVIACGAAPLSSAVAHAAAVRVGCRVKQGYGMTELGAVCMAPDDGPDRPESIGPPLPGVQCRVVDVVTGEDVPPGHPGELLVRSPACMRGYLGNEAATAATIDPAGWLHTGDLVRMDHDGWFHVLDRVKELIKYKGHQVAPAELEALLLSHPAVADAAVVGCPDEAVGELPTAFVVLSRPVGPDELIAFVAARVEPVKRIRRVHIVAQIPKSPSGKILRRSLIAYCRRSSRRRRCPHHA